MDSAVININNLTEEEINSFVLKFLDLLNRDKLQVQQDLYVVLFEKINEINNSSVRRGAFNAKFQKIKNQEKKHSVIEGFFQLISFFEEEEKYEKCAMLKKVKDFLLMDL